MRETFFLQLKHRIRILLLEFCYLSWMSLFCSLTDRAFPIFIICIDKQHRFCSHQKWWRSFEVNEHNSHTGNDQVRCEYFIFNDHIDPY